MILSSIEWVHYTDLWIHLERSAFGLPRTRTREHHTAAAMPGLTRVLARGKPTSHPTFLNGPCTSEARACCVLGAGLGSLRELDLGWCCAITDGDAAALAALTALTDLQLSRTLVRIGPFYGAS